MMVPDILLIVFSVLAIGVPYLVGCYARKSRQQKSAEKLKK